ncbi:TerD family protein [Streptomyces sp. M2CJ-2]|uniref:TerD family protein n=1 Tax=Streptomyces sp. M2CJ-2 TaxID=2803948 RepID=UPI00192589DB|nr:TerD family protein [Streptomyces sp. M2CJ-2]MBL3670737.1 TerD family protein [Streptomyces sp. M2CJ-2]
MTRISMGDELPALAEPLHLAVVWRHASGLPNANTAALLLDARGQVRGPADLVCYSCPQHPSGSVTHMGRSSGADGHADWLRLDPALVEPDVERIVVAAVTDLGTLGQLTGLEVQLTTVAGAEVAALPLAGTESESALVFGEFERQDGGWLFRAAGQGYRTGLTGLAAAYGIAEAAPRNPLVCEGGGAAAADAPPTPAGRAPADRIPAAVQPDPADSPHFEPYRRKGRGDATLTVPGLPAGPALVEFGAKGSGGRMGVRAVEANGYGRSPLSRRGRFLVTVPSNGPLELQVSATDGWEVAVLPASAARSFSDRRVNGQHVDVLRYTGPMAELDYTLSKAEHMSVRALYPDSDGSPDWFPTGERAAQGTVPLSGPALLEVDCDLPWSLQARPVVSDAPPPHVLNEYRGQGRRDERVEITNPTPGSPVLVEYAFTPWNTNVSQYRAYEDDDFEDGPILVNAQEDGATGQALLFLSGDQSARLRITDAATWSLRLLPLSAARRLDGPVSGKGTKVLAYEGDPALLIGSAASAQNWFEVDTWHDGTLAPQLSLCGYGTAPASGPLPARPGTITYVRVRGAQASWRLEPAAPATAREFDAVISGRGHEVLRYTGRAQSVKIDCASEDDREELELWTLDETGALDQRLGTGHGRHGIRAGLVQVRAYGRWSIRADG